MSRVKRGLAHLKKRRNLMKRVKGFQAGRKNLLQLAKVADMKAGVYAYSDRRKKKRNMRGLWQVRINAAAHLVGFSYSRFMDAAKKKAVRLDRKVLAELGANHPPIFAALAKVLATDKMN